VSGDPEELKLYFDYKRFWGHDRIPLLEERLAEYELRR